MDAPIAAIEAALRQNTSALPTALQAHEAPIVDPWDANPLLVLR